MIRVVEADRAVHLATEIAVLLDGEDTAMALSVLINVAEEIVAGKPGLKYALRNLLLRSAERLSTEDRRVDKKGEHS